jgi:hypothetical protein
MAKPARTKIKIKKSSDQLELLLPCHKKLDREGRHQVAATLAIDALALALIVFNIWVALSINNQGDQKTTGTIVGLATLLLFGLPLTLWILGAGFKNTAEMCKQLFSQTSVLIDRKQLSFSSKFWNFDWGAIRKIKVKDIQRVVLTNYQYLEDSPQSKLPCFVVLEIDGQTVNLFNAEHRLTKAEAKWVGKEVSRWLGVGFDSE